MNSQPAAPANRRSLIRRNLRLARAKWETNLSSEAELALQQLFRTAKPVRRTWRSTADRRKVVCDPFRAVAYSHAEALLWHCRNGYAQTL